MRDDLVAQLVSARASYQEAVSPNYDETLVVVAGRVKESGNIGKDDVGALLLWKRLRGDTLWARQFQAVADAEVRVVTSRAVSAVRDQALPLPDAAGQGRSALTPLPGFERGDALASALLLAAAPDRMAIYDRRAQSGLEKLGLSLSAAPGRYARYMALIEELLERLAGAGHLWSPREVDTALFWLGRAP